jgi:hypothetical protein
MEIPNKFTKYFMTTTYIGLKKLVCANIAKKKLGAVDAKSSLNMP